MQPYTILLAPDRDIAATDFREQGYRVLEARQLAEILDRAAREAVDLLVVGSAAEALDPLECCRRMKANRATEMIPIAVLNGSQVTPQEEMAALEAGADALLPRNGHPGLLFTRLRALMHRKAAVDRWEPSEAVVFALARVVERRDRQTGGHAERLAFASLALGRGLGLHSADLLALYRGGYLHDIGKVAVPDAILFKRGSLSCAEWAVMRTHTVKGEEICRPLRSLGTVLPIIRHHHERWDGWVTPTG